MVGSWMKTGEELTYHIDPPMVYPKWRGLEPPWHHTGIILLLFFDSGIRSMKPPVDNRGLSTVIPLQSFKHPFSAGFCKHPQFWIFLLNIR